VAMMRAAEKHGHDVYTIECASLCWRRPEAGHVGGVFGEAVHMHMRPDDHDWYRERARQWTPLTKFDAVIMRKDPPFDFEFLTATWLLERAEAAGVRVFNKPRALRDHSEKIAITEFPSSPQPRWWRAMRNNSSLHRRAARRHPQAARRHGRQPDFPRSSQRPEPQRHHRNADPRGTRTIMAQRYLPEISPATSASCSSPASRALLPGAHPQGRRDARQPGRRRHRRRAGLSARPRNRRNTRRRS
jgi:glutathione synthase